MHCCRFLRILTVPFALAAAVGCVDRRFVVTSNVPAAQIYVDGKALGPAPVDSSWIYAGEYTVTALAPGYEPYNERVRLKPKWYQYPPLDILAELLYPGRIEDVRRIEVTMQPKRPISDEELIGNAERLRAEGKALPPSRIPDDKGTKTGTAPTPAPAPGTGSTPGIIPGGQLPVPGTGTTPDGAPVSLPPGYQTPITPIPIGPTR